MVFDLLTVEKNLYNLMSMCFIYYALLILTVDIFDCAC